MAAHLAPLLKTEKAANRPPFLSAQILQLKHYSPNIPFTQTRPVIATR
jgi:hypothetical protein